MNGIQSLVYLVQLLGGYGGLQVNQNPKTDTIVNSLSSIAGRDKRTSVEEIEKQISIFDTQLSTMQIFAAIPQFAPFISPMLANIKEQKAALELVYDHFDAFSAGDGYIDKADLRTIREAAECDGNGKDFSEEDLEDIYDINGVEYDPVIDFSLRSFKANKDATIGNKTGDQFRRFGEDSSEQNILISDNKGDDTYTVGKDVEDANLVFTSLNDGDRLNLDGRWSAEQIYDEDNDTPYVLYTNENGNNVFVKGKLKDLDDIVLIRSEIELPMALPPEVDNENAPATTNSPKVQKAEAMVVEAYREILDMTATEEQIKQYSRQLLDGSLTEKGLANILFETEEYKAKNESSEETIKRAYAFLIDIDASEEQVDYWNDLHFKATDGRDTSIRAFINGAYNHESYYDNPDAWKSSDILTADELAALGLR
ncbi:MAG: hypothetical protein GX568_03550 [Candidatus Gastranaerophilales bacterium]|nr:hypothetical protein [Candidatus Gastranaerophilales bacterium]